MAIKCYNCDSTKNRECIDVSSSNTIIPEVNSFPHHINHINCEFVLPKIMINRCQWRVIVNFSYTSWPPEVFFWLEYSFGMLFSWRSDIDTWWKCMKIDGAFPLQTCTPQKLSTADPNSSSWLQKLIRIDIYSNNPYNVAMICQKISVVNGKF